MDPGRKSKSTRSGNAYDNTATSPASNQAAPSVGITRAELDAVVSGLYQQMEAQNTLMLDKLNVLLGVNQQLENNEETFAENVHDSQGKSIPQRAAGTAEGAPPQAGGSRPQPTLCERFSRQTSEKVVDVCPAGPLNDEEYLSGMIRQIMKESMRREEDESDWGFAPRKTPFTERILKAEFPKKFVPPTIPAYRRTSDPD